MSSFDVAVAVAVAVAVRAGLISFVGCCNGLYF